MATAVRLNNVITAVPRGETTQGQRTQLKAVRNAVLALSEAQADRDDIDKMKDRFDAARKKLIFHDVPSDLRYGFKTSYYTSGVENNEDYIYRALSSPLVDGAGIVDLSALAGLALFPVEAAHSDAWAGSPEPDCSEFKRLKELGLELWMVAPVTFFSASKWIKSQSSSPVLPGWTSIVAGLLPLIRDMYQQIEHLEDRVSRVERRMEGLERRVLALETQFRQAEIEMASRRAQIISSSETRITLEEPLLLAGELEGKMIVGPCWGPSLPENILRKICGGNPQA